MSAKTFSRAISDLGKGRVSDAAKGLYKSVGAYKPLKAIGDFINPDFPDIPVTKVDDPAAIPETGGDPLDALKSRKKRRGRAETIQAGSLIPENVGTKSLLG